MSADRLVPKFHDLPIARLAESAFPHDRAPGPTKQVFSSHPPNRRSSVDLSTLPFQAHALLRLIIIILDYYRPIVGPREPIEDTDCAREVAVMWSQRSMTAFVISVSVKVNVTIGPSRTFRTKGGRKQAIQTPSVRRTLGYTIPAEPLVKSVSPSVWEAT